MTRRDQTSTELSAVFMRSVGVRPKVRAPDSPWTVWIGVAGAAVLGVMVFNGLSGSREARAETAEAPVAKVVEAPAPAPQPVLPPAPPPVMASPPPVVEQSVAPPPDPEEAHWRAPTVVVDFSGPQAAAPETFQLARLDSPQAETGLAPDAVQVAQTGASPGAPVEAAPSNPAPPNLAPSPPAPPNDVRQSADERFAAGVTHGLGDTARATQMRDLGRTIPQGSVISAVLETAIDSDLPGQVRAVVSRDVRSFDGSRVLVPRGSRLVGQYKSAAAVGQTRAFVVWSRIITPEGVTIDVGSPATDRLGRGGLDGDVDTHFFRRFGSSILLSVVSAGTQALANSASGGDNTTLVIGSPTEANNVASIALQKQIDMPDTIRVAQGAPVQVSVARDLDFSSVVR
ncbi:MAG TPA: type IV secretion system protein VirB10 [Phenylobacterium sp.]